MKHLAAAFAMAFVWAAGAGAAQIEVKQPWVRSTVPGQTVAGAFMELRSPTGASLVGASSPWARAAELHESRTENGVSRMLPVKRLDLPAGKTVALKPGGYHLMLMDVAKPLKAGDQVPLILVFEQDGHKQTVQVTAEVRNVMAGGGQHGTH